MYYSTTGPLTRRAFTEGEAMTNEALKTAMIRMGERLDELDTLTALLSRFVTAAEVALKHVPRDSIDFQELANCCRATYIAGIAPNE